MDMKKILEDAEKLGEATYIENDISKEIMKVAKQVYTDNPKYNPWFRGVDMLEVLKHLGKANVRTHMEKLVDKHMLESGLVTNKKVYRIKILGESDDE